MGRLFIFALRRKGTDAQRSNGGLGNPPAQEAAGSETQGGVR